jgi:hypothetical protein
MFVSLIVTGSDEERDGRPRGAGVRPTTKRRLRELCWLPKQWYALSVSGNNMACIGLFEIGAM